jgi:sensor histidine kinase YesM
VQSVTNETGFRIGTFARRYFWIALGLSTAIGLLNFTYIALDDLTRGVDFRILERFVEEMTAAYGVVLLVPLVVWIAFRFPLDRSGRLVRLPIHLAALAAFSIVHTSWNWGTRALVFPLVKLGAYDYGAMPMRYFMELPSDVIVYSLVLVLSYLTNHYHRAQEERVSRSQLESRLARARLENLRAQIQPHFLFNALNTVSSVMYEDPSAADTMLSKLSELLRRTMDGNLGAQEVRLAEEVETLDLYLDLMRARFGERLEVEVHVEPAAESALVPALVLQPLVENALRHGAPPPPETARLTVSGERNGRRLRLTIEDNGAGFADAEAAVSGPSIGLPNTAARLHQLYGESAVLTLENRPEGGARVVLELPCP